MGRTGEQFIEKVRDTQGLTRSLHLGSGGSEKKTCPTWSPSAVIEVWLQIVAYTLMSKLNLSYMDPGNPQLRPDFKLFIMT